MSKNFKKILVGLIVGVTVIVGTGCSSKSDGPASMAIQSNSEKKFNKLIIQVDDDETIQEGFDGKDISKNVITAVNLPEKDSVKVKVILKQKGKTIATSDELELNLKKKKQYMVEFVDVSNNEVELKIKNN